MDNITREERLKAYQQAVEKVLGTDKIVPTIKTISDVSIPLLKKGDIFYTSWGYDQTNYDFLVILKVSKTGKTVKCQMTNRLHRGEDCQTNVQEPIFCPYGDVFTMHVRVYDLDSSKSIHLKGSYPFCNSGKMTSTRIDSFSKHTLGKQYYETMAEFGH